MNADRPGTQLKNNSGKSLAHKAPSIITPMSRWGRPLFRFERYVRAAPVRYDPFLTAAKPTMVSAPDRHRQVRQGL